MNGLTIILKNKYQDLYLLYSERKLMPTKPICNSSLRGVTAYTQPLVKNKNIKIFKTLVLLLSSIFANAQDDGGLILIDSDNKEIE